MGRAPRSSDTGSHRATPLRLAAALCLLISVAIGLLTGCAPDAKSAHARSRQDGDRLRIIGASEQARKLFTIAGVLELVKPSSD